MTDALEGELLGLEAYKGRVEHSGVGVPQGY